MPYDASDPSSLPSYVRSLSAKRRRQWADIWNSSYATCMRGAEPDSGQCESKAFSTASGVVIKQKGKAKHAMVKKATFKKLSYGERQSLPKRKFLVPKGSDGKPHLPIPDAAHLRNAASRLGNPKTGRKWGLSSTKRAQLQARAQRMLDRAQHNEGPHIGPQGDLAMDVATFKLKSEPVRMTDELVYRPATIFRAGQYPDKEFSLTPSELKDAAARFDKPIDVDIEHIDSPLDGHMGKLVAVSPSEDGSKLHGMLAIPRWLHGILPNAKLSATWDRASKSLVGLALVRNPRVPDAALFAAFSVDQVARGEKPLSSLLQFQGPDGDEDDDDDDDDDSPNPFVKVAKKKNKSAAKVAKKTGKGAKFADAMVARGGWASQSGGARDGVEGSKSKGRKFPLGKGPWGQNPDLPVKGGGVKSKKVAKFAAQAIHDIAKSKGAICRVEPEPAVGKGGPYGIVRFDKNGKATIDQKKLAKFAGSGAKAMQGIHDVSLAMGAACAPTLYGQQDLAGGGPWQWQWPGVKDEGFQQIVPGGMTRPHFSKGDSKGGKQQAMGKNKSAKKTAMFSAMLADLDSRTGSTGPGVYGYVEHGTKGLRKGGADRALAERNAQLEVENQQMRQQGIYDRAVAFADNVVTLGHILPVEREQVLAQHMQAAHDDWRVGTATFSDGDSRVSQFEKYILGRPKHNMDMEAMATNMREAAAMFNRMKTTIIPGGSALPGVDSGAPMAPERKSYLLNLAKSGTMTGTNAARNGSSH